MSKLGDIAKSAVGGVMGGSFLGLKSASKTPNAPAAPDPNSLVQAQAEANRVNQVTPWGSTMFTQGGDGNWTATTRLSPQLQSIWNKQLAMAGNAGSGSGSSLKSTGGQRMPAPGQYTTQQVGSPVPVAYGNPPGMPPARELGNYGDAQYKTLEDALYQRAMSPLEPQFAAQSRAFEQSMADRGMPVGSEAYADQFNMIQDAQNRARNDAALAAVIGSRGAYEADRSFNNSLNQQDFSNYNLLDQQAKQWALQNQGMALNRDQVNYNQLASLLAGVQPAPVAPIDVMAPYQMQYQGQMNAYNNKVQSRNDMLGGVLGLMGGVGAAGIMASDEQLKDNVTKIGEVGGLNFYKWTWKPEFKDIATGPTYGFIAQEVQQTHPQHVVMKNGYLAIDYTSLLEEIAHAE